MKRRLLLAFVAYLHRTGALSVPPEDLVAAIDRFAVGENDDKEEP